MILPTGGGVLISTLGTLYMFYILTCILMNLIHPDDTYCLEMTLPY